MINFGQFQPPQRAPDLTGSARNAQAGLQYMGDAIARRRAMAEERRRFDANMELMNRQADDVNMRQQRMLDAERYENDMRRQLERRDKVAALSAAGASAYSDGNMKDYEIARGQLRLLGADLEGGDAPPVPGEISPPHSIGGASAMGLAPVAGTATGPLPAAPVAPGAPPPVDVSIGGLGGLPAPQPYQPPLDSLAPPAGQPSPVFPLGAPTSARPGGPPPVDVAIGGLGGMPLPPAPEMEPIEPQASAPEEAVGPVMPAEMPAPPGLTLVDSVTGERIDLGVGVMPHRGHPEEAAVAILKASVRPEDQKHYIAALQLAREYMGDEDMEGQLRLAMELGGRLSGNDIARLQMEAAERRARIVAKKTIGGGGGADVYNPTIPERNMSEKAVEAFYDKQGQLMDVKGALIAATEMTQLISDLNSGNTTRQAGAYAKIARLQGHTGVLTEADVAHLKRGFGIESSMREAWEANKNIFSEKLGEMDERQVELLKDAALAGIKGTVNRIQTSVAAATRYHESLEAQLEAAEESGDSIGAAQLKIKLAASMNLMESRYGDWTDDFVRDHRDYAIRPVKGSKKGSISTSLEVETETKTRGGADAADWQEYID